MRLAWPNTTTLASPLWVLAGFSFVCAIALVTSLGCAWRPNSPCPSAVATEHRCYRLATTTCFSVRSGIFHHLSRAGSSLTDTRQDRVRAGRRFQSDVGEAENGRGRLNRSTATAPVEVLGHGSGPRPNSKPKPCRGPVWSCEQSETVYPAANNLAFIVLLKAHFIQGA